MADGAPYEEVIRHRIQQRLAERCLNAAGKNEEEDGKCSRSNPANQKIPKSRYSAFSLQNILWLIASMAVFHFTDFYLVVLYDPRIDSLMASMDESCISGSGDFVAMVDFPPNGTSIWQVMPALLWFNVGAGLIAVTLAIAAFLIVWLSFVKKLTSDEWEQKHPAAIPVATASFIVGSICVIKSLWPVWGILTPVVLVTLFMGVVVVIAMFG